MNFFLNFDAIFKNDNPLEVISQVTLSKFTRLPHISSSAGSAKDWVVGDHTKGDGEGMVKVVVDLTGCGFSSPPVVHAMLNGSGFNVQTKVNLI